MSEKTTIKTVCIVGSGLMGTGIGFRASEYGYNVKFFDISSEVREKLRERLINLKNEQKIKGEVSIHDDLKDAVEDTDLIIEAIPEKLELKMEIFSKIDKLAPPKAILSTNSSSIPVSKLEGVVKRKDKLLNLHFYVLPTYPMADIQRGTQTTDETLETGKKWIESIDITPLIVKKECYGFVFNRIWRAIKKDVLKIWANGNADFQDVDKAMKIFTSVPLEPFKLIDRVGLDVIYDIEMSYYKESGDPKDKPPDALLDKVKKGELGIKSGKGFYNYDN